MTVGALLRNTLGNGRAGTRRGADGFLVCGLVATLFVALACLLTPLKAEAASVRLPEPFSPLAGSGSNAIATPGGIAVDETSGNVFVNDGTNRTVILGATSNTPAGLKEPFQLTGFSFPAPANAVAVDNSAGSPNIGTLYVLTDVPPKLKKFRRDAPSEQYVPAGELPITTPGANSNGGIAIDPAGNVFVSSFAGESVAKFNAAGTLVKTFSFAEPNPVVRPGPLAVDAAGDLFIARTGSGSVYKFPADAFGEISTSNFEQVIPGGATGIAVDQVRNTLFIATGTRVTEYDAATLAVKSEWGIGILGASTRLAVNSATDRVYVSDNGTGKKNVAVFGSPVPLATVSTSPATGITGTKATLNGIVNAEGLAVTECFFEYGSTESLGETAPCVGAIPPDTSDHFVSANISGLSPNGEDYFYRLVAANANGTNRSAPVESFVTAPTVETAPATGVGITTATLNGTVHPEGLPYLACKFEYGLTTSSGFEAEAPCNPPFGSINPDFVPHSVSADLANLQPNATYRFRLTATNANGTVSGQVLTVSLGGPPQIIEVRASNADKNSARLEAVINPRGFQTNYFFEFGVTPNYSTRLPISLVEPSLGNGKQPAVAGLLATGLAPGTIYHYRVVARNSSGITTSSDQIFQTLNACGLPDQRCFELVSPREPGLVGTTGPRLQAGADLEYQAATGGPGGIAYDVEHGFPNATRGADVLYLAKRGPAGWGSTQLSPPILTQSSLGGPNSNSSKTSFLNDDLSCGFVASSQPLTADPGTNFVREAGGSNLYRINPDGSYTAVTTLPPQNPVVPGSVEAYGGILQKEYQIAGASQDCSKVVFASPYVYPDLESQGTLHLYEWENGILRNLAPEGAGQPAPEAVAGTKENKFNTVSVNGSRVFFSAKRIDAPNTEEDGFTGIFVREAGATRDVTNSETAVPTLDATYQYATPDGSRVFFTAEAGLTTDTSSSGTDLYEYNVATDDLRDLSVEPGPGGAQVGGFVGASDDGSRVYFLAQAQLVPGRGNTLAQNESDNTYSLYASIQGALKFVGTVWASEFTEPAGKGGIAVAQQAWWTSRVSPSGRYLLFETSVNNTGYYSGSPRVREAYLYDAGSDSTVCVSCRQDGQPSVASAEGTFFHPLEFPGETNSLHAPRSLVEVGGQAKVFFASRDRLATGGVDGLTSLYQWSHGQVFTITTEPPGLAPAGAANSEGVLNVKFDGSSADGSDLYFGTTESLTWEDTTGRPSLYDARILGGFPAPPAPPAPCNPTAEGSCPGPAAPPPSSPSPATATFNGPGNEKPKKQKKKKKKNGKHKKKHKKKNGKKHKKKNGKKSNGKRGKGKEKNGKKHQGKSGRDANSNRRAGK